MEEQKLKSEGVCALCNKKYTQRGINRHLKTHLEKMHKPTNSKDISFLLKIETNPKYYNKTGYFLYLWVNGTTYIDDIDAFLRDIWLECCGHLSSFIDNEQKHQQGGLFNFFDEDELAPGEIDKGQRANECLYLGQKMNYTYDFGSSTELQIKVEGLYQTQAPQAITLLSRNEPLHITCDKCGIEPAVVTCIAHAWAEDSLFCKKCARLHAKKCDDFKDYAEKRIVNSPRFGVCDYEGGIIDTERDGAFNGTHQHN